MTPDELAPLYAMHYVAWVEAARHTGARHESEDAVHDACVAALGGAVPLDGESPEAMLGRLVTTYASGYRRQRQRDGARRARWGELPPFEMCTNIEQRVAVQHAVDHLKASHHLDPTVVWATIQGYSVRQLASLLGRSDHQSTAVRVQGTWSRLREVLAMWGDGRKHRGRAARGCGEARCQPGS